MEAQQVGTLDQLAPARISLGVGVGGREHDYQAGRPHPRGGSGGCPHLTTHLPTGHRCCYERDPETPVDWVL